MPQEKIKTYKINLDKVVWGSINKNTLLIKISIIPKSLKSSIFVLNGVSLEIWNMLIKNYDSQKILKKLIKKYPFPRDDIKIDFTRFIKQLKDNKIIDEIH